MNWVRRNSSRVIVVMIFLVVAVASWLGLPSAVVEMLKNENSDLSTGLDVGDKVGGIIAAVIAVLTLARTRSAAALGAESPSDAAGWDGVVGRLVDRKDERSRLRTALRSRRSRVIIVHGDPGVGKTHLVKEVLRELGIDVLARHVIPLETPSADTLLQDLSTEGEALNGGAPPYDESLLGKLEMALTRFRREAGVIVIDNAELLLNQDRHLTDLALDEALETLATAQHRIKVIVITKVMPRKSTAGETWLADASIEVRGLPFPYFRTLIRARSGADPRPSAALDDERLKQLCDDLDGRPRLAELFDAIIDSDDGDTAESLADEVRQWAAPPNNTSHVETCLLDRMRRTFRPERARIYNTLAAFATSVNADDVAVVVNSVEPAIEPDRIKHELGRLGRHIVREIRGRYFLPVGEARRALDWQKTSDARQAEAIRGMLAAAAERLAALRTSTDPAHRAGRDADLAEIDAWLRAGSFTDAYRAIKAIDTGVEQGRPDLRLRSRREEVSQKIAESHQASNYQVLGYLYHCGGDLKRAEGAFRRVLELGAGIPSIDAKASLHIAWLRWSQGRASEAYPDFAEALRLEPDDPVLAASAHEGMARCHRRRGRFTEAIREMEEAFASIDTGSLRLVSVTARLARLYLDVNRVDDANDVVELVSARPGTALQAVHLDVQADILFAEEKLDEALPTARQALEIALRNHDAVAALQARLTICRIRLQRGEWSRARREAALAERYRGMEQSLLVLAVRALAARRCGQHEEARKVFRRLLSEAYKRTNRDGDDFAAWELAGLALGGLHLEPGGPPIAEAVDAFTKSRPRHRELAGGHDAFVAFLVREIADPLERDRLAPALALLTSGAVQRPVG